MPIGSTKATRKYPALPSPGDTVESHTVFLRAVKEALEVHERRTKDILSSFVRVKEMDDLDFIDVRGTQIVRATLNVPIDGEDDQVLTFDNGSAVWADAAVAGGGGGVTDHGALTGLTDDDHSQYVLRSILTTNGDIFVRLGGAVSRLGVGSEGQHLEIVSGLPAWATPSGGGGGLDLRLDFAALDTEITTDSPTAYWKFDEDFGAATAADSIGTETLTVSTTISAVAQGVDFGYGSEEQSIRFNGSPGTSACIGASAVGTPPWNGDVTFETVVVLEPGGSGVFTLFEHAASGESLATNITFAIYVSAEGRVQYFHEYGSGSDERHSFDHCIPFGTPVHIVVTKDASATEVRLFVDGVARDAQTYTNEQAGGTSGVPRFGEGIGDNGSNAQFMRQAYTALYIGSELSDARIAAHADALYGGAL